MNINIADTFVNRIRIKTEGKAKVVAAVWWTELSKFLAAPAIFHHDDLKKTMNIIMANWWTGCFEKLDFHSVHFTLHQTTTLSKWLFSHKLFFKSSFLLNG